jgi:hypothetical protein
MLLMSVLKSVVTLLEYQQQQENVMMEISRVEMVALIFVMLRQVGHALEELQHLEIPVQRYVEMV